MEHLLRGLYTTPLPCKLILWTQYEHHMVKNIQCQLKESNIIIRQTDKSKMLYTGRMEDHFRKALKYTTDTNSYLEILSGINPCMNHLRSVLALIDLKL